MLPIDEQIQEMTIHGQLQLAELFLGQLQSLYVNSSLDEVDELGILDCLGVVGLSLTIGNHASRTFCETIIEQTQERMA